MPNPIILTENIKREASKEFNTMLDNITIFEGMFNYSKSYRYEQVRAAVWLTQEAYRKIIALVTGFQDEVGWHGMASRKDDGGYIIEDICVYPQEVTGATVSTDWDAYAGWLYGFDDDGFSKIRMHGHSHVNMGVSPSGVDIKHRQQIVEQLKPDMFYIFMIWNKSLSVHTLVYDMEQNIFYDDRDVDVRLLGDDGIEAFMSDAREKVQRPCNITKNDTKSQNRKYHRSGIVELDYSDQFHEFTGLFD